MGRLPRVYAIVDVEVCARLNRAPIDVARAFLSAGVRFLQVRAKTLDSGAFFELSQAIALEAARAGAMTIINDRADIAAVAGADGVHVGQEDLTPADVRKVVGDDAVVGLSTHTEAQWRMALEQPVSYVAIGPVYGTQTKSTGYEAVGIDTVRRVAAAAASKAIPVVAIGGITLERAPEVIDAGADSVAIITDLMTGDPESRARAILRALDV